MNSKAKGSRVERKAKAWLEQDGWYVTKAGGSLGVADLVALRLGDDPLLVQVKSDTRSPWVHLGPEARRELRTTAAESGATAIVLWWPARAKEPTLYGVESWPT